MERFNVVIFAQRDQSRVASRAMIEGEDQGTGKVGGVESAGGVAEMMIEAGKAATGKELAKLGQCGLMIGVFAAGLFCRGAAVG